MSRKSAWAGALLLAAISYVTYHSGLKLGFYLDDYLYIERAGRTEWGNALQQIFDPHLQAVWYRPLQALQFLLEYQIFRGNSDYYHLIQISFHAINVLLLYLIVWRVSKSWMTGLLSGLFFATFSVFPSAVNWVGIVDPLAAMFYLASIWFWVSYLRHRSGYAYVLAVAAFVLALLSKQIGVTLPITLFLVDIWVIRGRPWRFAILRDYALYMGVAILFVYLQLMTPSTHTMASVFDWKISAGMVFILIQYLVLFFFPYARQASIDVNQAAVGTAPTYLVAVIGSVLLARVIWRTRDRALLFLVVFALLNLLPVLPFPFIEHRYLYLPVMSMSVLLSLVINRVPAFYSARTGFRGAVALALSLLMLDNGLSINASALAAAEWADGVRVPFSAIEEKHPAISGRTLFYFVNPPGPVRGGLGGMAMARYGPDVWVKDWSEKAEFSQYETSYLYYGASGASLREIVVEKNELPLVSPPVPINFGNQIQLDGYEVPRLTVRPGTPIILLLYWRAIAEIKQDYVVSARLVTSDGKIVSTYSNSPHMGQFPTQLWEPNRLVADAVMLLIDGNFPAGTGYRVELGWHDSETGQPLSILNDTSEMETKTVVLGPFKVIP